MQNNSAGMSSPARIPAIFALMMFALTALAFAQDDLTFDSMRAQMNAKGCTPKTYAGYTVFTCDKEQADYYFTTPEHAAAPAVVKRFLSRDVATETWWSFGGDPAALARWLDQFHRMDRQAPRRWPLQAELPR